MQLAPHELIVTKTDPTGHITYANRVFMRIAGYAEHQLLGKPHNLIRHPDMPRGAYRLGLGNAAGDFTVIGNYFDKNGPSPAVVLATLGGAVVLGASPSASAGAAPVRFTSPLANGRTQYAKVAFETDLPRIEPCRAEGRAIGCVGKFLGLQNIAVAHPV